MRDWCICLLAVFAGLLISGCHRQAASLPVNDPPPVEEKAPPIDGRVEEPLPDESSSSPTETDPMETEQPTTALATFGGGCFWCVEAVFQEVAGVQSVVSGYTGGRMKNPTYDDICTGRTGHAEVCQIAYDPSQISYADLLEIFFKTHDPTTLNRQGNDFGTQYRSAVFYHDEQQRAVAEKIRTKLDQSGAWENPIVTEITAIGDFYPAEKYHQDYYRLNPQQGYCQAIIRPKMDKFRKVFAEKIKK